MIGQANERDEQGCRLGACGIKPCQGLTIIYKSDERIPFHSQGFPLGYQVICNINIQQLWFFGLIYSSKSSRHTGSTVANAAFGCAAPVLSLVGAFIRHLPCAVIFTIHVLEEGKNLDEGISYMHMR